MIRNLMAALGRRKEPVAAAMRPAPTAGQKAILIIEDHPDSLRAMCLALADETYRLETADTAEAAIQKLSSFHPDLILLDSQVPAADGTRLARHLLADAELAPVPIVALTERSTHGDPEPVGRFDGHIGKPIDARSFPGRVRAFLESPRQEPSKHAVEPPLPTTPAADRRKQAAELLYAIEADLPYSQFAPGTGTGLQRLAEVVGGLEHGALAGYLQQAERLSKATTARSRSRFRSVIRFCRELVERDPDVAPGLVELRAGYLENRRAEMSSLEHALKNGDFAALRKAGHNLKGTGAAYGFAELTDIGRALEAAAKDDNAAAIEALLDQIDAYIGMVGPSPEHRGDYAAGI
ncbi:MAG: response regulator [Acidobacteriia bacterium]|nr:response regulator [Terriglobia bacterium]